MIKTFRGLLADGGQDRIRLGTNQGKVGYRIVKFEVITNLTGTGGAKESTLMIWKTSQSSVSTSVATVDFTDSDMLAVAFYKSQDSPIYASTHRVIFDNEIFNQDIYITHTNTDGTVACNYYIELEIIPLTDQGAEYTTLKDIRTHS